MSQLPLDLSPYRNQNLFSDYYLRERLDDHPAWAALSAEADHCLAALRVLWKAASPSEQWNEAQTEENWIKPVLEALGHVRSVQVSLTTPLGSKTPDYVLFGNQAQRQAAEKHPGSHDEASLAAAGALAVADAKRWDRKLDITVRQGDYDAISRNPVVQIDFYLRHTGLAWGILSNGRLWRLYHRDSSKQLDSSYEVDLPALIERNDVAAFRYFYAFFRRDAFLPGGWLDTILAGSRDFAQGVSDTLKGQVYEALTSLAQGFLSLPQNQLQPDDGTLKAIYDNSLIVLYRLLFALFAESRELLPADSSSAYYDYSLRRLVDRLAGRQATSAERTRLWETLRDLWQTINLGDGSLGIPAYNGGLFAPERHPFLEQNAVGDRHLQPALEQLAYAKTPDGQRVRVDYRDLSVRHLGAIYEGLLEFTLAVKEGQVLLLNDKGERKASGSYYTPDYIVQYIVEQTVGPLVDALAATHGDDRAALARAILKLDVLDPAMGSGHFLVGATDYLAQRLVAAEAPVPEAEATSGEAELAYWRRRVVASCIYGVDLNPLAVELAKLSLWLNTVARDRPLSFLDHHLRVGNSLVGARLEALGEAAPSSKARKAAKAAERQAEAGQQDMFAQMGLAHTMRTASRFMLDIEGTVQATAADVHEVERAFMTGVRATTERHRRLADLWTAQYFGVTLGDDDWKGLREFILRGGDSFVPPRHAETLAEAERIARERRFFHWELEFPEVFFDSESGQPKGDAAGFDAVIGNPPYVRVQTLRQSDPAAETYFRANFQTAVGSYDLYMLIAERSQFLLSETGIIGLILPNKFLTAAYGEPLRRIISNGANLRQFIDFGYSQVFEGATTYTCLLFLNGKAIHEIQYAELTDPIHITGGFKFKVLSQHILTSDPWTFQSSEQRDLINKMMSICHPLSEVATRMFQGIRTSANEVFILTDVVYQGDIIEGYSSSLNSRVKLERDLCSEFVSGDELSRYEPIISNQAVLVPYEIKKGKAHLLKWHRLVREYPHCADYLLKNESKLRDRERGRLRGSTEWYGFIYPKNLEVIRESKIVTRDIVESVSFTSDTSGTIAFVTGYGIAIDEFLGLRPSFVLSILNSKVGDFSLKHLNTFVRGGYVRIFTQFLEPIPIRRIAFTTPDDERARLTGAAIALYERGDDATLLDAVATHLRATPEQGDIVHDLLAYLAEQMIALNQQKQQRTEAFWLDLEGVVADDATFQTLRSKGKWEQSLASKPALAPFVDAESRSSRTLDESLAWDEAAFKAFVQSLVKSVSNLSALVGVYRAHHGEMQRLVATIARTDALIDQIVYRLYGLTEEEVAVVEGRA